MSVKYAFLNTFPLMHLLGCSSRRSNFDMTGLVFYAGVSNAALMAIINSTVLLVLFCINMALYVYAQRFTLFTSIMAVEVILTGIRLHRVNLIRRTDLEVFDTLCRAEIFCVAAGHPEHPTGSGGLRERRSWP